MKNHILLMLKFIESFNKLCSFIAKISNFHQVEIYEKKEHFSNMGVSFL